MAIVPDARWRALDNEGDALSGAKLWVYQAGLPGVLANIFTDAALSTPASNPVTSDSDGYFPQFFASNASFDLTLKTSAGVTLKTWEDVPGVGGQDGSTWDFTNSRARISGSGGTVSFEGGPATGDDIGGTVRIGGWSGSEADSIELDGPTNVSNDTLTVNGKKVAATVYTPKTDFTTVASVDITIPNSPTGVRMWKVFVFNLSAASSGNLQAQFGYENGAVKTGSADYLYNWISSSNSASSAGVSAIEVCSLPGTGHSALVEFTLTTPNSGAGYTILQADATAISGSSSTTVVPFRSAGIGRNDYGRLTTLRLKHSSAANISGSYLVVPLRGTGDA